MDADSAVTLADGTRLAYVAAGSPDGDPVLYFHGTPSSRLEATVSLEDAGRRGLRIIAPDRPGCGGSTFVRYGVRDCPGLVSGLLDALEVDRVAVVGVSGGGRYATAFAAQQPERVRRVALVASTASSDLPGVRASWGKEDRMVYGMAVRAPWLLRAYLRKLDRRMRSDPTALLKLFSDLSPLDREVMARPEVPQALQRVVQEAMANGCRGVAHDFALEAGPWGVDPAGVRAPVDVWHGLEDTVVRPVQGRILAEALPTATPHLLPREGHISLRVNRMPEILERLA